MHTARVTERSNALERRERCPSRHATPLVSIRDYLHAHVHESVSIAALARMSGLTAFHFIRAFRRQFGLPPHAYQIRLRLARACELLGRGVAISQAAYECGFADQSHLSRQFKCVYGVTPATWASAVLQRSACETVTSDNGGPQLRSRQPIDDGDIVMRSVEPATEGSKTVHERSGWRMGSSAFTQEEHDEHIRPHQGRVATGEG